MGLNAFQGVGTNPGLFVSTSVVVSHVAVVTADLDGFRAFYEGAFGLDTISCSAPAGHARQAVIVAGNVMLHVFEVPGFDPAPHGFGAAMFERGRLDHLGFSVGDEAALIALRDRLLAVGASSGTSGSSVRCSRSASTIPKAWRARSTASTRPTTHRVSAPRTRSSTRTGSNAFGA